MLKRSFLGGIVGLFMVAVPYSISPFPINSGSGAIAVMVIAACTLGMGYGGSAFFEGIAKLLDQSGLY